MASGSILIRCPKCRKEGKDSFPLERANECPHRPHIYWISYRVGLKLVREKIGPCKKDAERRRIEVLSQINNGTYRQRSRVTFEEFVQRWLNDYAKERVKHRTYVTYEGTLRIHVIPHLKNVFVEDIIQLDIESILTKLARKHSAKTVNNVLKLLKTVFKYAKRWRYTNDNPALDVDSHRVVHQEMDFLKPEEIRAFLDHSREPWKTLFMTAVLTGMRKSELNGLQWGDVDFRSGTIFVRRSLQWKTKGNQLGENRWFTDAPKTRNSARAIVMSPKLKETLELHRLNTIESGSEFVFTNKAGQPFDPDHMYTREFLPTLSAAGLRKIRFHDLRHTYASLLINQGENLKFTQSQLGHASIQTTVDRYGHLMPVDKYSQAGVRLDKEIFDESVERKTDLALM